MRLRDDEHKTRRSGGFVEIESPVQVAFEDRESRKSLLVAICNPPARQIVGRHFDRHAVARQDAYEVLSHLAGDLSQYDVLRVVEPDFEESVREFIHYHAFRRNQIFFSQTNFSSIQNRPLAPRLGRRRDLKQTPNSSPDGASDAQHPRRQTLSAGGVGKTVSISLKLKESYQRGGRSLPPPPPPP